MITGTPYHAQSQSWAHCALGVGLAQFVVLGIEPGSALPKQVLWCAELSGQPYFIFFKNKNKNKKLKQKEPILNTVQKYPLSVTISPKIFSSMFTSPC